MAVTNPRQHFFQALNALQEGKLQQSEKLCRELLALNARDVNSLRLLGQIQHQKGDLEAAENLFREAIANAGDYAHAYADLGKVHYEQNRLPEAEGALRKALSLNPSLKAPTNTLARVLDALGRDNERDQVEAVNRQRKNLKSKIAEAYRLLAEGKPEEGEAICREVLRQDPDNFGAKDYLIDRAIESNRGPYAERLARSLVAGMPENGKAWLKLATALSRQDKLGEAEAAVVRALEIKPDQPEARMLLGGICSRDNRFAQALEHYNLVLASTPEHTPALSQKATTLKTLGRQQEAIETYRQCLRINPKYGEAPWSLSNLKTYRFSDEEVASMESVVAEGNLPDQEIVHFNYALGKAYEHRESWDKAFACYRNGNLVKKRMVGWNADEFSALVDRIIATFDGEWVAKHLDQGLRDPAPVFILGLPRSGSTLQEQILSSHSQVEGTRELPYIPWLAQGLHRKPHRYASRPYPEGVRDLGGNKFRAIGETFLHQASRHRTEGRTYFIDKLPNNFLYVGLILLALPDAKIINTRRNPIDNCFSCFKQLWAEGQHFTYDLEDLGRYYRDYHRLMEHWRTVFPGKVHDVQYEDVVSNLARNVAGLLDFCGLPWEEQCLRFHKTERAVNTASSEQVRQPIYRSAIAYWKHFEQHLGPLKESLGDLAEE